MKDSNKIAIYSFGENGNDKWYAGFDNVRIKCDEAMIDMLWKIWVVSPTASRADDDSYTIFKADEPLYILNK